MTVETGTPPRAKLVKYYVSLGVAMIELTDAPANTYTYEMMQDLDEAILQARMDEGVHVIIIRGAGDKFFCGGASIKWLQQADPLGKYYFCLHANETLNRLPHTPKLVIAALNGHCVGGGLEVALACDVRLARKGAGKIGFPESNLGLLPGTAGTQRLPRLMNKSLAFELMAKGETFDFERARELGLVNHVFEAETTEDFMRQVIEYAMEFCPPKRAARAVGAIKRSIWGGEGLPEEVAQFLERELMGGLFRSRDGSEGLTAYVEKRPAVFTGE